MANVLFKVGTSAAFQALGTKDNNTLYFLTDTFEIYKGDKPYAKDVLLVDSLPEIGIQGVLYVNTTTFTLHAYTASGYKQVSKGYATTIGDAPTDNDVPTTKAVADYVTNKIADVVGGVGVFVTDVTYSNGVLSVAKGAEPVATTLTGVAHDPTYDAETRKITLPVFGGDALEINLGKDLVVTSGTYDAKAKAIKLTITSGDEIVIPVESLIDIYVGIATSTATVTVSDDNKISVSVKVSAKANNAIVIEDDGLYLSLPDAYTKAEVDGLLDGIKGTITTHIGDTIKHITAEERAAWNAKATTAQVATAKSEAIAEAKTYSDSLNTAMDGRVKAVEAAVAWTGIE